MDERRRRWRLKETLPVTLKEEIAAANATGDAPPAQKLWRSTFDKDISRSIRFFLWMLIHGGYKVGKFWDNIPNLQHRGQCGVHESMEHVLT
jgi:ribonuclease HI